VFTSADLSRPAEAGAWRASSSPRDGCVVGASPASAAAIAGSPRAPLCAQDREVAASRSAWHDRLAAAPGPSRSWATTTPGSSSTSWRWWRCRDHGTRGRCPQR
jgi:hypothetical protein